MNRARNTLIAVVISAFSLTACGSSAAPSLTSSLHGGKCHKDSTIESYSSSIVDASKLSSITPLGTMNKSHVTPVDHLYINFPPVKDPNQPSGLTAGTYNVTSPADGWIVNVEDFQAQNQYPYPDYRVVVEHSCNLYSVFIHLGALQGVAKAAVGKSSWSGAIPVKAGDVIADDSANPGFDFGTYDSSKTVNFLNPASYSSQDSWKPHTADSFAYFPSAIKSALEAKSLRTTEPLAGTLDLDKAGTLQGSWFIKGTNGYRGKGSANASFGSNGSGVEHGYWDSHLAIAPHNVDIKSFIYSIGDWNGCPCQFMSVGNIDPLSVKPSSTPTVIELVGFAAFQPNGQEMDQNNPVKGFVLRPQSDVQGLLALQLSEDGSMKVEKFPGVTSKADFKGFTEKAKTYVR